MREHLPQVTPFLRLGGREWYLPQALRALNHRPYRLFWIAQLVSLTGSWMQSAAQQWLVYRLTGSALKLGLVMLAATLPVTVLSPIAGVLVDRLDRRRLLITLQAAMMALATALAILTATGVVRFGHVIVLAVLTGIVNAFDMPARQAFTVQMVGREDLVNAVALNSSIFNGARLVGPAVAGILVAQLGEAPAFAINALTYVAILAALLAMRLPPLPPHPEARKHPLAEMGDGARHLLRDPRLLSLVVMVGITCTFAFPFTTLVPVIAVERLGLEADGFGFLMSSFGVGALVGASMLAILSADRAGRMLVTARVVSSLGIAGVGLSRSVPLTCLGMALAGWGLITQLATSNTLIQLDVPDHLRGRVMSAYTWCAVGTAPLGALFMGTMAEHLGAPAAMVAGAAMTLASLALVPTVLARSRGAMPASPP